MQGLNGCVLLYIASMADVQALEPWAHEALEEIVSNEVRLYPGACCVVEQL
jgi:hypothetical protein